MKTKIALPLGLAALISVSLTAPVMAHDKSHSYWLDKSGAVVRDGSGDCLRTGSFKKEEMTVECGAAAPAPEPVAEPAPAPEPKISKVSLSAGALFDLNKDTIKPEGKAELDALAANVSKANIERVDIAGHTDSTGSAEYNKQLSMRRANAVKNYLMDKGIDPKIMTTVGWGEDKPVADNKTKEGRAANRRVEITLHGTQQEN